MLQAIRKHMERQVSSIHRGKSHTEPSKEKDIQLLENSYRSSQVHNEQQGRTLRHRSDVVVDLISEGAAKLTIKKTLEN